MEASFCLIYNFNGISFSISLRRNSSSEGKRRYDVLNINAAFMMNGSPIAVVTFERISIPDSGKLFEIQGKH
jgi:hypothetical protein